MKLSLFSRLLKGKCSVKHKTLNINKEGKERAEWISRLPLFCSVRHALAHIRAGKRCHWEGRERRTWTGAAGKTITKPNSSEREKKWCSDIKGECEKKKRAQARPPLRTNAYFTGHCVSIHLLTYIHRHTRSRKAPFCMCKCNSARCCLKN